LMLATRGATEMEGNYLRLNAADRFVAVTAVGAGGIGLSTVSGK